MTRERIGVSAISAPFAVTSRRDFAERLLDTVTAVKKALFCAARHIGRRARQVQTIPQDVDRFDKLEERDMHMRTLLFALLLIAGTLQTTPSSACPAGYRSCGNYCCGGK